MYILNNEAGGLEKQGPIIFRYFRELSICAIHDYWSKAADGQDLHIKVVSAICYTAAKETTPASFSVQGAQPVSRPGKAGKESE